ncbi:MAG: WecB/TagA/CpsF family glycosyltransferase [Methylotenera sp.]|nr:WecB/TagA/CpsF family glycosyltransferase [Methylotenera sp.]
MSFPDWKEAWIEIVSKINVVHDAADEAALLNELSSFNQSCVLAFVNAHAMNLVVKNEQLLESLLGADYLLRDGSGMTMLYKFMGIDFGLNMNGTDFIPKVLEKNRGRKIAIWGTRYPYLIDAVSIIKQRYNIEVVSIHDGFESVEFYIELSKKVKADLILLGMGMPKQEQLANQLRKSCENSLIICGGAIIDFLGNKVTRAPKWMRKFGLEWLYRFICEPKRLFKRYVIGNPLFLFRAAILK